jgi:ATP-dependent Zn protease
MNERVGNVSFEQPSPGEMVLEKPFSEATAQIIDEEAYKMIGSAMERTVKVLEEHREVRKKRRNRFESSYQESELPLGCVENECDLMLTT